MMRVWRSILAISSLLLSATLANAGALLWTPASSCTTNNCGAMAFYGTVVNATDSLGENVPFVMQVWGAPGQCLKLWTDWQEADLELVVVSPSGAVWRNDDAVIPGCSNCSLLKIATTTRGLYTVHVNHWSGVAGTYDFRLWMARYTSTSNPNCSGANAPMAVQGRETTKVGGTNGERNNPQKR